MTSEQESRGRWNIVTETSLVYPGGVSRTEVESAATITELEPSSPDPSLATGIARTRLAGRYEILGLLGVGGMGTVYRVRDHELDEIVALKLLSSDLGAGADALQRFRREVRIARKVTHPNVARTFDIGEHEGARFLTMEYVEGEALDARLSRGRLAATEVVRLALGVCAGLGAAHAAGVVHRDLKPANVLLGKERVVITDFGIARALESNDARTTSIAGTPAYMAPEQVEGKELDGRADLYALGVMLFEMLTGKLPFTGDSPVVLAAARLIRPAPDPASVEPTLTPDLAALVRALLARDPGARPADAAAVAQALAGASLPSLAHVPVPPRSHPAAAGARGPAEPAQKTVAVLPFVADAPDDAYLAEALAEELADTLSTVKGLRVRPFAASKSGGGGGDARAAGERLGVHVVVEGTVRRRGGALRVNLRLIGVTDGFQIFADRFDDDGTDLFGRVATSAKGIAEALTESMRTLERLAPVDPIAHDLYLRGRYLYRRGWNEANAQAIELLKEAHLRAPDDARIAGLYAMSLRRGEAWNLVPPGVSPDAIAARAVALDPRVAEGHLALATGALGTGRHVEGATHLARALEVAPHRLPDALLWRGEVLAETGPTDEAVRDLEEAIALEPDLVRARTTVARVLALAGDAAAADESLRELPPNAFDQGINFVTRARLALWRNDPAYTQRVVDDVARARHRLGTVASRLDALLEGASRKMPEGGPDALRRRLEQEIPHVSQPRMRAFFDQLRTEMLAAYGLLDDAEARALAADAHGTIDVLWFDRCPVLAPLRVRPGFRAARDRTAARADAVRDALELPSARR